MRVTRIAVLIVLGCVVGSCRRTSGSDRANLAAAPHLDPHRIVWDVDPLRGRERCEVHQVLLQEALVPIVWGLDSPDRMDRRFLLAETTAFPHADDPFPGGDILGNATLARVRHCPRCLEAKAVWLREHPDVDAIGRPRLTGR